MLKLRENPIEGVTIQMAGNDIVVPALNMRQLKTLRPQIAAMDKKEATDDERVEATLHVILQALRRNYPDATAEDLDDLIDLNNIAEVTTAVMGQTGFVKTMGKLQAA